MKWATRTGHPEVGGHIWYSGDESMKTRIPLLPPCTILFLEGVGRMGVMEPSKQRDERKSPPWAQNFLF